MHVNTLFFRLSSGKAKALYDSQAPACPVCQAVLRPGELQEHMEQELSKVAQLQIRYQPGATGFHRTDTAHASVGLLCLESKRDCDNQCWQDLRFSRWALPSSVARVLCLQAASLFPKYFTFQPPGDKSPRWTIVSSVAAPSPTQACNSGKDTEEE